MATIVNKLGGHITSEIPQIFDAVFECTLNMINKVKHYDQLDAVCNLAVKILSGLMINQKQVHTVWFTVLICGYLLFTM